MYKLGIAVDKHECHVSVYNWTETKTEEEMPTWQRVHWTTYTINNYSHLN
jgi:hypothetical protein